MLYTIRLMFYLRGIIIKWVSKPFQQVTLALFIQLLLQHIIEVIKHHSMDIVYLILMKIPTI